MRINVLAAFLCPGPLRPLLNRIRSSPLGARLASGAFWSLAGAVVSRGLLLLASILLARILGKMTFGELGIIQNTVGMFGVFAGFGLGLTATKHVAEFRSKDPLKAGRIMSLSGLVAVGAGGTMAAVLALSADWLAANTLAAPHLGGLLRAGAVVLFLDALNGAQTGALAGFEAFRTVAVVNLLAGVLAFPLIVGGGLWAGLPGAVWGLAGSRAVNWLFNHLALRREAARFSVPFSFAGCGREWPVLWSFSLPSVLNSAMLAPTTWACSTMLVNQPNGYAEMGLFNAANQWRSVLLFLPTTLATVSLPMLANLHGEGDHARYARMFWHNVVLNTVAVFMPALLIIAFARPIMSSYGRDFAAGYCVLIALTLSAALSAAPGVIGQAIASTGQMWWGFVLNTIWAVAMLAFSASLVHKGAQGLGWAICSAYGLHLVTISFYARYVLLRRSARKEA